jgi:hypothetical protein
MAGLVSAIHVFLAERKDVDARLKAGHDEDEIFDRSRTPNDLQVRRLR